MVKKYTCTFCGTDIEPGTGSIFVKNDGSLFYLCSSKCRRNQTQLKRTARRLKWTEVYEERLRRRAKDSKKKKAKKKKPKAKKKKAKAKKKTTKKKAKPKAKTKKGSKSTGKKKASKSKSKETSKKSKTKKN